MNRQDHTRLNRLYEKKLESLVDDVLEEEEVDRFEERLKELEAYQKLISAIPTISWERVVALGIAFGSFVVVALLWIVKTAEVSSRLQVEAQQVAMTLSDDWVLEGGFEAKRFSATGISWMSTSLLEEDLESDLAAAAFSVEAEIVRLNRLWIAQGTRVEIRRLDSEDAQKEGLQIKFRGGAVEGVALVEKPRRISSFVDDEEVHQEDFAAVSEIVRFDRRTGGAVPMVMTLVGERQEAITRIPVEALDFLESLPDETGAPQFRSTILGGEMKILDIDAEIEIHEGDHVTLDDFSRQSTELSFVDSIVLKTDARAGTLRAGPEGFEKDLRPSLLELFSKNPRFALLWAGLLFVSGILWNLRKSLSLWS